MHTHTWGETTFHHNGDYSGEVLISVDPSQIEHIWTDPDGTKIMHVRVPFDDIKELVAQYVASARIATLEQEDADVILGVPT